jgi:hypothetical protein
MRFADCLRGMPVLLLALAGSVTSARASLMASATLTSTQIDPTTWLYDVTLDDIGTTNLGTFWFAWEPGEDFMPTAPTSVSSPAGWTDAITHAGASDGFAIQWIAGAGAAVTPGNSLTGFSFDSKTSPTTMAGHSPFFPSTPILDSFVYSGAPFSDAGFLLDVQAAATPEPSGFALMICGGALAAMLNLRRRRRSTV